MKNIYLTSTFTNPWNVEFNHKIGKALEYHGITCYLPHRDTNQDSSDKEIFNQDIAGIDNTSLVVAVALNESPNWGAEVGYAYVKGKKIIALTNKDHSIPLICNHMLTNSLVVEDLDNIDSYIENLILLIKEYI